VSYVYNAFCDLPKLFETDEMKCLLTKAEIDYVQSTYKMLNWKTRLKANIQTDLVKERFQFIYGDAHGIGYLLDPRYIGEKLERNLRLEIEDFILKFLKNCTCGLDDECEISDLSNVILFYMYELLLF